MSQSPDKAVPKRICEWRNGAVKGKAFAFIIFVCLSIPSSAALRYEAIGLGTLGGPGSIAIAINEHSEVAGDAGCVPLSWGSVHGFYWSRSTGMIDLGPSDKSCRSSARAINDWGQIVGCFESIQAEHLHAFYWIKQFGLFDMGTLGGYDSSACAVNDHGVVAGTACVPREPTHAFVYTETSGMTDLGCLPGGFESWSRCINERGQVAGYSHAGYGNYHAFLWTSGSGMHDLGTLGGRESQALAINRFGDVVGWSMISSGETHAFFWSQKTGMMDISPPGSTASIAQDISSKRQVVLTADVENFRRGFVWDARSRKFTEITAQSPDVGWMEELRINDSGLVAGSGWFEQGLSAFVWREREGITLLPALGGSESTFRALNNRGEVVGAARTASDVYEAVLWEPKR